MNTNAHKTILTIYKNLIDYKNIRYNLTQYDTLNKSDLYILGKKDDETIDLNVIKYIVKNTQNFNTTYKLVIEDIDKKTLKNLKSSGQLNKIGLQNLQHLKHITHIYISRTNDKLLINFTCYKQHVNFNKISKWCNL